MDSPRKRLALAAFALSGVAGLTYEVTWSRYLGLFVGHGAYAQILVLAVYLGGMALGALAVSDVSARLPRPLAWYAAAEGALGVLGLAFDPVFQWVTGFSYEVLFPALPGAGAVGAARWGLAGLMILPQAALLGATFPLMAAALVRSDRARPGREVAAVYLVNTLGGAAGVLLAGFWFIAAFGLPGTLAVAGALNLAAACLAWWVAAGLGRLPAPDSSPAPALSAGVLDAPPPSLAGVLLTVSFGTAVASFAYEVGWIRMLSLVLGGATHAFELMLSAFILGLALGAFLIRQRTDEAPDPVRLLGWIQVAMGVAAVLTLPVYVASFEFMAYLVEALSRRENGYALFNLLRYGVCLAVMLPATVLAGTTLPLLTGTLMRRGLGEEVIGRVYAVNTVGSVLGAGAAGLAALPLLGLKGLLLAGAVVDVALGVWLLERSTRWGRSSRAAPLAAAAAAGALLAAVAFGIRLDHGLLTSGVFRYGTLPQEGARRVLYYADGRTATVSAYLVREDQNIVLAINGKPDASLGTRWLEPGRDTLPPAPVERGQDFTTQLLGPLVGLAYAPHARSAANVGHGSGMTGSTLLTSPSLERLVTVEIEPKMVEGSFAFLPMNAAVFDDPRSTFVFDDAKSFFANRKERFDLIFAEPSNPWVSGTASLFTLEFYGRVRDYLADGGVLAQWMQIYEITDELFVSVLRALDQSFPEYRGYLVGDADVVIVAGKGPLPEPDWSVLATPGVQALTAGIPPFRREHLEALLLFDETTFRPVLRKGTPTNSDFRPILDLGAERARFLKQNAEGLFSMAANRFDLRRMLDEERKLPMPFAPVPSRGLEPAMTWGRGAWLRGAFDVGGGIAPQEHPEWNESLVELRAFLVPMSLSEPPASWEGWLAAFDRAERELHWGTAGWASAPFYGRVYDYIQRAGAPPEVRAAVDVLHGAATFDWEGAAAAADLLIGRVALGERWVRPTVLLDIATVAYLKTGRPEDARRTLDSLDRRSGRGAWNLRSQLLGAIVADALAVQGSTGPVSGRAPGASGERAEPGARVARARPPGS